MADQPSPDRDVAALLRRLDELLEEASRLRSEVARAVQIRRDQPFWPDRRRADVPHDPDRRAR